MNKDKMELEESIKRCEIITTTKFNNDYSIDSVDKQAIETVLHELENYKEGNIISLKLLENFYLVNKDKEKQMTLANKKLFDDYIPKKKIEDKINRRVTKLYAERDDNLDYASDYDFEIQLWEEIKQELLEDK